MIKETMYRKLPGASYGFWGICKSCDNLTKDGESISQNPRYKEL